MIFFCWIITFYNNWRINLVYYLVLILVIQCNQSVGQISAILFSSDPKLAITFATLIFSFGQIMGNILIPVKRLHYSIQYLSELSYFKLAYDSMIVAIYGFDRCLENEISLVLFGLGIERQMFWQKIIYFVILCIVLKLLTLLLLIFKINYHLKDNRNSSDIEKRLKIRLNKISF